MPQLQVIKGLYEYTDRREPEKRPYEHSNHSDETLVDSNHESTKPHEARSVPHVHLKRPAEPSISQVHGSEDHSIQRTPSASGSNPADSLELDQTPTPPPTPPGNGPWPARGRKPPKGRVIIFEDNAPSDEETSTPLSVLPPDVLGASFRKFEVQETIEQVLERMQSR